MVDQNLLAVFLALAAVAVLTQTGLLVGFYVLSLRLSRQADRAVDATRSLLAPLERTAAKLEDVAARRHLRRLEAWLRRYGD